jgi:trafficking protein particle complex subunit 13
MQRINPARSVSPPSEVAEFPAPTLRVMRLQKPTLHVASPGITHRGEGALRNSLCLPDSLTVYIGELFSAYLGVINSSKEHVLRRLTVSAQLQTPSQRWQLPSKLEHGTDVPPSRNIDAIVSHSIEESGQHILRVEVAYQTPDGSSKTFRKFYRFQVISPLQLSLKASRIGDSECYVSVTIEYTNTDPNEKHKTITLTDIDFACADGLSAHRVDGAKGTDDNSKQKTAVELFDSVPIVTPGSKISVLFLVKATSPNAVLRGMAGGDYIGHAHIIWRRAMGEIGQVRSDYLYGPLCHPESDSSFVVHRSGLSVDVAAQSAHAARHPQVPPTALLSSDTPVPLLTRFPVTVEAIQPPTQLEAYRPTTFQFLIVNHSEQQRRLQVQFHGHPLPLNNNSLSIEEQESSPTHHKTHSPFPLSISGASFISLGDVPGRGGSQVITIQCVALQSGWARLYGCLVVDMDTGEEITQPPLLDVFVPELESDEIENEGDKAASSRRAPLTAVSATGSS